MLAAKQKAVVPFTMPCNLLLCGETNCGKTQWLEKLLHHQKQMFDPPPDTVLVMFKRYQDKYNCWEQTIPNVRCVQGIQKGLLEPEQIGAMGKVLLVLDDYMQEIISDPFFNMLYTAGRHLGLCGILSVWHQIFPPGRFQRTISLNQHVYILMKSPRIKSQVPNLGSQLGVREVLTEAYKDAASRPFGYLVADFSNKVDANADEYAIRTNIFPDEPETTFCYS